MRIKPNLEDVMDILDDEELPSGKKAVLTIIDLRTKVLVQGIVIKILLSTNSAFIMALILRLLLK